MFKVVLLLAVAVCAALAADVDEKDVVVGTAANFDGLLNDNAFVLAEFYAPWCGHCKKLTPEYAAAATALVGKAVLVKVDATIETDLASKFGVKGYPTLVFFRSGAKSEYTGGRTKDEIVSWVSKKSGPPSTQLADEAAVAEFTKGKLAVVGTFTSRDSAAYKAFLETAKNAALDDFQFADVVAAGAESVKLYTKHSAAIAYDGAAGDSAALATFILSNGYPLVDELPGAWERYQKKGLPLAILFVDPKADNKATIATMESAAKQVAGAFSFSFADGVRFAQQLDRMGIAGKSLPALAAMKLNGKANFPYEGSLTDVNALAAWGKSIADGSLKPKLRSEDVPAEQKPLFKVVGKNFESVCLDPTKDVLLEIYAPWCGHCKSLQPEMEKLAEDFAKDSNVIIGQLDGTQNDVDVEYRGFPSIFFFPAEAGGMATMKTYEGGRTQADLKAYIEKNRKSAPGEGAKGHSEL